GPLMISSLPSSAHKASQAKLVQALTICPRLLLTALTPSVSSRCSRCGSPGTHGLQQTTRHLVLAGINEPPLECAWRPARQKASAVWLRNLSRITPSQAASDGCLVPK